MATWVQSTRAELARAPPGEFTARRNALAASLAAAGRADEAAAVRRLRKPSAALWALNRLALDDPQAISHLLGRAEELRDAERSASSPAGARRAASLGRAFRDSVKALGRRAGQALVAYGAAATAATRQRIHASLMGLATASRDEVRALSRGELDHELEPPDVSDVLALLPRAPSTRRPRPVARAGAKPDRAPREGAVEAERRAQEARRQARAAVEEAERRAEQARRQARAAVEEAERAAERARTARRHAAEQDGRARAARRHAARRGGRRRAR